MASELNEVFKRLNGYFSKHRVVSEEEIAAAVSEEVDSLDPELRQRLEKELKGDLKAVLTASIVSEPISVYSPNLTSQRNYLGEKFYHYPTHDFLADELEEAFKRLSRIRSGKALETATGLVRDFLVKSGYTVEVVPSDDPGHRELEARKKDAPLTVYLLPSINFVPEYAGKLDPARHYVIVVPTEKTPAPFIHFCHDEAEILQGKKVELWVVEPEKKAVNPFIGYTHDDDIYRNFENPKLAALACRMYGLGKDLWVRQS